MKVLVIPEDPRLDQYMLKPLIEAALRHAGKPRVKVTVCQEGSLRGDATIAGFEPVKGVIEDNLLYDAFILCVDQDCRAGRVDALKNIESAIRQEFPNKIFVAVCGVQELEVWVLAGMTDFEPAWEEVRAECHPKETYFESYAERHGVSQGPGKGRKALGEEAAKLYAQRVRRLCPEIQSCEI